MAITWKKLINKVINLAVLTKVAPTKGNITYEYNPFYNYRIQLNMYEYKDGLYSLADLWNNFRITLKCKIIPYKVNENGENVGNYNINTEEYDCDDYKEYNITVGGSIEDWKNSAKVIVAAYKEGRNSDRLNLEKVLKEQGQNITSDAWYYQYGKGEVVTDPFLREAGELTDFITDELSFDLEHPVSMLPQYSYDGSVNLILNDGLNTPKLINSRFSATGRNTYEVCDRKGNNDTNIYDLGESFTLDTSLYKLTESIAQLKFEGVNYGGNLKIGNYHFYFKVADADGNESDFIAESGLVSIFLGSNSYSSVSTGERDENSHKLVLFYLSNLDSSYDYVHVYYSRYSAENDQNRAIEYKRIDKNYLINNANFANIIINGYETTFDLTAEDINLQFNVVDSAYTAAICQNRLFMANVHKPDIPYVELLDLSLRILPYLHTEEYEGDVDENYNFFTTKKGYIDPKYIYEKTGYWTNELYRLGIVYILPDNTLSPVFNIRGGVKVGEYADETLVYKYYTNTPLYDEEGKRNYISYNEEDYQLVLNSDNRGTCLFENAKGVVLFTSNKDTNIVYSIDIHIPFDVKLELSKYVKGYFFVRQPRIPLVLALGITIGINKESGVPTIPTKGGIVEDIASLDLSKTHVCVGTDSGGRSLIDEVVYLSEGFLSRYTYELKEKSSNKWKKIGKIAGIAVAIVAAAAATVITCGGGLAAIGTWIAINTALPVVTGIGAAMGAAVTGALAVGAAAVAAGVTAAAVTAVVASVEELVYAFLRPGKTYNRWNTKIPNGYKVSELGDSRRLILDFDKRIILTSLEENYVAGILCPDYELDQPHFNSIFISDEHLIQMTNTQSINLLNNAGDNYFDNANRYFYMPSYYDSGYSNSITAKIIPIADNLKIGMIEDLKFRARAGEAEEAFRIESVGSSFRSAESAKTKVDDTETINNRKINSDIVRGSFGPFLGFYDKLSRLPAGTLVNIYTAGYDPAKMESYVYLRACDASTFYTISDRFILNTTELVSILGVKNTDDTTHLVYRGDCYICLFTHRVHRNFQDPSALFNDEIIEEDTWREHYDPSNLEELDLVNRGDVNAILIGTWVTFKIRSSNNLNIRTLDSSWVDESAMTNHPRTYYPKDPMSVEGVYKTPESRMFNTGFKKLLGERYNYEVPDVPWIKNWYGTRIMYSNINISDSFLNGFRVFKGLNYRDYTREYGEITKLVSLESSLLCVFEHGVALIPVNERTVAGDGPGGAAYINTSNVLPENPKILSDVFGSLWADSILKVPGKFGDNIQYVYGVDTVARKIWRTDGLTLTCISDMKIQEFLNNNISLSESELTPMIGIRNVKTFYNAFKRDVLFTFYDNTYGFEEKVWNLCWNELMLQFVTFYSWVPSVMENINNIPFSFNRNTSRWLAKLGVSHAKSSFADGITLTNVIIENEPDGSNGYTENYNIPYTYTTIDGDKVIINLTVAEASKPNLIGVLMLSNRTIPELDGVPQVTYSLERDLYGNYKIFNIKPIRVVCSDNTNLTTTGDLLLPPNSGIFKEAKFKGTVKFYGLYLNSNYTTYDLMSERYYRNNAGLSCADEEKHRLSIDSYSSTLEYFKDCLKKQYPIFKDKKGNRPNLTNPVNMNLIVRLINIKAQIEYALPSTDTHSLSEDYYDIAAGYESGTNLIDAGYYQSTVAVTPRWNLAFLSTDFWRHGQAGIIDIADDIYPTYWYGEQHPFEFEFIVANEPGKHKIFDNLQIISNKAEPESFHYEIVGECYDFARDKENMYIRLEATKELYQYNGSDITYNHDYNKLEESRRDVKTGFELKPSELNTTRVYDKSTIFPLYYGRKDHINEIYDSYCRKTDIGKDYSELAGAELIFYRNLNEIRIRNNCLAVNVALRNSRNHRGNMHYKEDLWDVLITPINLILKNELDWSEALPSGSSTKVPVEPTIFAIPEDIKTEVGNNDGQLLLPDTKTFGDRGLVIWLDTQRKEARIKDKYLKVRIRYSGKDLAIITAINTLYTISYA